MVLRVWAPNLPHSEEPEAKRYTEYISQNVPFVVYGDV